MKKLLALLPLFGIIGCSNNDNDIQPTNSKITYKSDYVQYVAQTEEDKFLNCIRDGNTWTTELDEFRKTMPAGIEFARDPRIRREIKEILKSKSTREYCKTRTSEYYISPNNYKTYEDDDEEELDDAMFDEGTPQCDEGTWYEENGYC